MPTRKAFRHLQRELTNFSFLPPRTLVVSSRPAPGDSIRRTLGFWRTRCAVGSVSATSPVANQRKADRFFFAIRRPPDWYSHNKQRPHVLCNSGVRLAIRLKDPRSSQMPLIGIELASHPVKPGKLSRGSQQMQFDRLRAKTSSEWKRRRP